MAALLYTTTEGVRAALGVTALELPDARFTEMLAQAHCEVRLGAWLSDHATIYAAGTAPGATAEQVRQAQMLQLWNLYYAAWVMAAGVELYAPQEISDGKMRMKRTNQDWVTFAADLLRRADDFQAQIETAIGTTTTARVFVMRVTPAYDPVLGALGGSAQLAED